MARRFGWVRKLPSGRYQASYMSPHGDRVNAPLTFPNRAQADTWLAAQRTDIARGTWQSPTTGTATLRDYSTGWLVSRTDLKPGTVDLYDRLLRLHIVPQLGHISLKAVTPAMVRTWHTQLGTTTGATAQAQSYRLLRTILNQAARDGEISTNPCQLRGASNPRTVERPAPSLAQIHALAGKVPARYHALVLAAAYGGLRFGELTALTRADVNLSDEHRPTLTVRRSMSRVRGTWIVGTPKSDAGNRMVTLPGFLGPVLTDHLARFVGEPDRSLVFGTASGRPLARSNWTATFKRARKEVGKDQPELLGIHFHDLRHAAATAAVQTGATLKDTMARLGHASPRAALIYQHTAQDRDEAIAAALNQVAPALTTPAPGGGADPTSSKRRGRTSGKRKRSTQ